MRGSGVVGRGSERRGWLAGWPSLGMSFVLFARLFVCMFGLSPVSFAFANIPGKWSIDLELVLWQELFTVFPVSVAAAPAVIVVAVAVQQFLHNLQRLRSKPTVVAVLGRVWLVESNKYVYI